MLQPCNQVKEWEKRRHEASSYYKQGKFPEYLNFAHQNLQLAREIPDRAREGYTLNDIGLAHLGCSQPQKALECFHQALLVAQELGKSQAEAAALSNLGSTYNRLGKFSQALVYFNQALQIFKKLQDSQGEVSTLNDVALIYTRLGEPKRALLLQHQILAMRRLLGDLSGEATTLNGIGFAYSTLGQYEQALEFLQAALPIQRAFKNLVGEATTLNNIASAAWVAARTGVPEGVIAIDGKTSRRTRGKGKAALHLVSAFAARQRLVLGQAKVADKSNEIVAIPKLLDLLQIRAPSSPSTRWDVSARLPARSSRRRPTISWP